jgi:hypothetical protein
VDDGWCMLRGFVYVLILIDSRVGESIYLPIPPPLVLYRNPTNSKLSLAAHQEPSQFSKRHKQSFAYPLSLEERRRARARVDFGAYEHIWSAV